MSEMTAANNSLACSYFLAFGIPMGCHETNDVGFNREFEIDAKDE